MFHIKEMYTFQFDIPNKSHTFYLMKEALMCILDALSKPLIEGCTKGYFPLFHTVNSVYHLGRKTKNLFGLTSYFHKNFKAVLIEKGVV